MSQPDRLRITNLQILPGVAKRDLPARSLLKFCCQTPNSPNSEGRRHHAAHRSKVNPVYDSVNGVRDTAPGRTRTCDHRIRNPMLYPLSYRRLRSFKRCCPMNAWHVP